ncbi:helix-turn-helix domain-containing protein [Ensifer aridi]|uniref:helix-turn-helix domain-containing protein n=1 Tax=Ensifer aridi TaxID=1708715 RepID=UPI000A10F0A4|nr:helix-turn-helix domain-containing protein [Ensifer aridi]
MTDSMSNAGAPVTNRGYVDIGDAVRRSREAVGYSVEDLALTCGLTGAEITRIELGDDVDPDKLRRIAAALRVPTSTFLLN